MRLLPCSLRGIWLLAGAVWCAACAGLWWALPVVPRAVIAVEPGVRTFAFSPLGDRIVGHGFIREENPYEETVKGNLPDYFWVWDCATGRLIAGPVEAASGLCWRPSPDRRWWYRHLGDGNDREIQLFDVASCRLETLRGIEYPIAPFAPAEISSDSQRLLFEVEIAGEPALALWNLNARRLIGTLPGVKLPADASGKGNIIAGTCSGAAESNIQLFDLGTLRPLGWLHGEDGDEFHDVRISGNGTFVAATYTKRMDNPGFIGDSLTPICRPIRCWNVGNRQQCFPSDREPCGGYHFIDDRLLLLRCTGASAIAEFRDSRDGETNRFEEIGDAAPVFDYRNVAPDESAFVVQRYGTATDMLGQWFTWFGVKWPFRNTVNRYDCRMFETTTGRLIGDFPGCQPRWSPDSRTLATFLKSDYPSPIGLWNIPPRKSLTWFAAGAAILALPIVLVAWRRTRKLRGA
jgi:hypothetical protein